MRLNELEIRLFGMSWSELRQFLAYDSPLVLLVEFIEGHYMDAEIGLDTARRACGMSKNNLNRRLRQMTGLTFAHLLDGYRVVQSISKALDHNASFTQIALDCGFGESSSYSRTVKRVLGCSPTALLPRGTNYRRELRLPIYVPPQRRRKNLGVPRR